MHKPQPNRAVVRSHSIAIASIAILTSSLFTNIANAQSPATVDPEREFTYADNQAIINITSSLDGSTYSGKHDLYAGAQATTLLSGGGGLLPASFDAYCVDIASDISRPKENVTVESLDSTFNLGAASGNSGVNVGGAIAWLYNNNIASISGQSEDAAQRSAALQLSIWTVEYNWTGTGLGGIDPTLNTGNFNYRGNPDSINPIVIDAPITSAIRADAEAMLTTWNGQTTTGTLLYGSRFDNQSLVGPPTLTAVAPEPAALTLLLGPLIGSAGHGLLRRRRQMRAGA